MKKKNEPIAPNNIEEITLLKVLLWIKNNNNSRTIRKIKSLVDGLDAIAEEWRKEDNLFDKI